MTANEIRNLYGNAEPERILAACSLCDPNARDEYHEDATVLQTACDFADAESVAVLLSRGALPDLRDRAGRTALHHLALLDDRYRAADESAVGSCAALLFGAGADLSLRDRNGESAVSPAAFSGREGLLRAAVAGGRDVSVPDPDGNSPLHLVCRGARYAAVELRFARQALEQALAPGMIYFGPRDRETQTAAAQTALEKAQRRADRFLRTAELLVTAGLSPDAKNRAGRTPWDDALESGDDRLISLLKK